MDGGDFSRAFLEQASRNGEAHLDRLADNRAVARQEKACQRVMQRGLRMQSESSLNPTLTLT